MKEEAKARFTAFVGMRRKWFAVLLVTSFTGLVVLTGRHSDSAVEIIGISTVGALIVATVISLASIPVVWMLAGRKRRKNGCEPQGGGYSPPAARSSKPTP